MPKENIERAIEKGKGIGKGENIDEVIYEGFVQGGVAVIVEALTDNKQRTTSEVKNILEKNGGTLGSPGSVSYQFEQKGLITVNKGDKTFDDIFMIAAESGAQDVEDALKEILVYTEPHELAKVREKLNENNLIISDSELTRKPLVTVLVNDKGLALRILSLVDKLENLDDVQKVYSNFDIPDSIINEIKPS